VRECAARIAAMKPKSVGFTVDYSNYFFCQFIADALKEMDPTVIIIFGGIVPSIHSRVILENNPFVDICSRNESEETCLELLSRFEEVNFDLKRAVLDGVKGITYQIDGEILHTPDRNVILTQRSIPDFLDKYPSPYLQGLVKSSKLGILTARGCNQCCVYCMCPVMSKQVIATHSPDRVLEELAYISTHLVRDGQAIVDIFDDTFTLLPRRAFEICRKMVENKIKLSLACTTRCDKVNEELLCLMKEAGFNSIEFSLESAVPRLLRIIGKVQHPHSQSDDNFEKEKEFIEKFKKYVVYAKQIGIKNVYTSIMLGLPTETPEEGRQTMNLIQSLSQHIDFYGHNVLRVHPGTPLFFNCKEYGVRLVTHDHQVQYKTITAYDTRQIPLAPRSSVEVMGVNQDKDNIKLMSLGLLLSKKGGLNHHYFNNIILWGDIITGELAAWLRQYMAVNGSFMQIYSGFDGAKQHYYGNEEALMVYRVPTNYYAGYYQTPGENDNGIITLTPSRTYLPGEPCGITFHMVNTALGLSSPQEQTNPLHTICIDRPAEKQDALQLHGLLAELANKDNPVDWWVGRPVYPYISSLCRWECRMPNCNTLETVIVDALDNIKTCWNGKPIGKVGMPLPEIIKTLKKLHLETRDKRNCVHCPRKSSCTRCVFPCPLSEEEYCHLKRDFHTEGAAELMRMSDMFKDLSRGGGTLYHADSL
jgi:radical SAM superfamily enzyme YgiQ (UPF0313 family)